MRRRELLGGAFAGAVLTPLAAASQSNPSVPIVGYLDSGSPETETVIRGRADFLKSFEKGGFVAGRNVAIEYRFAEGRFDRLPMLAAELVRLPVTVLVATSSPAAVAAKNATATIPVVFASAIDPLQLGLVSGYHRSGGNATGITLFGVGTGPKRLELLRDLLPEPHLFAVLFGPTTSTTTLQIREMEAAALALRQPLLVLRAQNAVEVETEFGTMTNRQAGGLVYGASIYFQGIAGKLIALAARDRIPAIYEWPEFVEAGGLMSYNTSRGEGSRLLADYAGRILKGAKPADLPVQQPTKFELVINLKTAKALGLTVPPSLLARADEVIE